MRATLAISNRMVIESGELAADPSNVEFLTRFA